MGAKKVIKQKMKEAEEMIPVVKQEQSKASMEKVKVSSDEAEVRDKADKVGQNRKNGQKYFVAKQTITPPKSSHLYVVGVDHVKN